MKNSNRSIFEVSKCTKEFLDVLTEIHARLSYFSLGSFVGRSLEGEMEDWQNAKKLTALNIIESYLENCKELGTCPDVPECCSKYIEELDKDEAKRMLAYFIWEKAGRPHGKDKELYFEANDIINSFFDKYEKWKSVDD